MTRVHQPFIGSSIVLIEVSIGVRELLPQKEYVITENA